jgi:hypothetical protein
MDKSSRDEIATSAAAAHAELGPGYDQAVAEGDGRADRDRYRQASGGRACPAVEYAQQVPKYSPMLTSQKVELADWARPDRSWRRLPVPVRRSRASWIMVNRPAFDALLVTGVPDPGGARRAADSTAPRLRLGAAGRGGA